jgi:hypothetical protein
MKKLILLMLVFMAVPLMLENDAASKTKAATGAKNKGRTKQKFIDLQGLDIQGMIERPQTLYILKRADLNFDENYDEYDYTGAIIDTTYKDPF